MKAGYISMPLSEAQKKAKKKYEANNYDVISTLLKKGERERIKAYAQSKGKSLNGFVIEAINTAMSEAVERDERE